MAKGNDGNPPTLASLKEAWDCDKLKVSTGPEGEMGWSCGWCKSFYKGVNATKALAHVLGLPGKSIAHCQGKIPATFLERYGELHRSKHSKKNARQHSMANYAHQVSKQAKFAAAVIAHRRNKRRSDGLREQSIAQMGKC